MKMILFIIIGFNLLILMGGLTSMMQEKVNEVRRKREVEQSKWRILR